MICYIFVGGWGLEGGKGRGQTTPLRPFPLYAKILYHTIIHPTLLASCTAFRPPRGT